MSSSQNNLKTKQFKSQQIKLSKSHIYACFQQPQTIDILKYLTMSIPNKLLFDSTVNKNTGKSGQKDEQNPSIRKVKQFRFQRIYCRQEKLKFAFSQQISHIIEKLFKGYNQAVFIYGTQESKKDKILIGESQNSGFLLSTLSQLFEFCHEKQIQNQVTIKISCSIFKQGKFVDPFKINQTITTSTKQKSDSTNNTSTTQSKRQQSDNKPQTDENQQQTMVCDDMIEGKYFLGTPQIIIRNMRTAMKIINMLTKKISQRRQSNQQQNTQNIIFTVKLQIDTAYDQQSTGQVYEYSLPKLYIVKLGNPSINNTLNGINKNNQWFINMFNFLQSQVLENKGKKMFEAPEKQLAQILNVNGVNTSDNGLILPIDEEKDGFTEYIKTVVMQGVADIHCFTSLTNKMTSNQCLTAFIFNNYLSSFQTKPQKTVLNIYKMRNQKTNYEEQLMNLFVLRETEINKEREVMEKYRVKYNIQLGDWGSNIIKVDKEKLKTRDSVVSKKVQKDMLTTNKQSQKKFNQTQNISRSPPSSTMVTHPKIDTSLVKQSIRRLLSVSCNTDGQPQSIEWQIKIFLLKYIQAMKHFTNCCNIVEYEYAQVLSQGCEKLNKYIFNEEVEEFFYAKKVSLQVSGELKAALRVLKEEKLKVTQMESRILKRLASNIKVVNFELQILKEINARVQHQELLKTKKNKVTNLLRQRDILVKIFQYYNTMSFHYIYEDNIKLITLLQRQKKRIQEQLQKKNITNKSVANYEQMMANIKKGIYKRISQKKQGVFQQNIVQEQMEEKSNMILQQENDSYHNSENQKVTIKQPSSIAKDFSQIQSQNLKNTDNKLLQQIAEKAQKYKMKKKQNQLDNMFTNSNVGVVRPHFHKRNK